MDSIQTLIDRMQIIMVVDGVGWYADRRQWDDLRRLYADELELDYTSLVGGAPVTLRADDLIAAWTTGLSQWDATQHMTSNHRVEIDGDTARVTANGQAIHWLPNASGTPTWATNGYYEYTLVRSGATWQITRHVYVAVSVTGPRDLLERAGVRVEWLDTEVQG